MRLRRRPLLTALVAVAAAVATLGIATAGAAPAQALAYDPDRWDAGNIISDANFYDGGGMSVDEIKRFLNSMAPSTCGAIANTSTPCLADARDDIRDRSSDQACGSIKGDRNQTAARVIAVVAKACNISPQVLLVTLQKEQALITSADPSQWAYDHAMGWGCPDSAPCETTYNGLFNQLYMGAKQFQNYRIYASSFAYRKGQTASIAFSPDSSCGRKSVTIDNWATAALYNYTPYTPNQGALNNYPGTATCGSYGNRNFWANYNQWFGSSITAGGYFLKTKGGSDEFLTLGDDRYRVIDGDRVVKNAYGPFRPSGTVSKYYLKTFRLQGRATQILVSGGGVYYLVDRGKRFRLEDGCAEAVDIGFSCSAVVQMSKPEIDLLERKKLGGIVKSNAAQPSKYVLFNGRKHEFVDKGALAQYDLPRGTTSTLSTGTLSRIDLGRTVVGDGDVVRANDGTTYWQIDGQLWRIPEDVWQGVGFGDLIGAPVASALRTDGLERNDPTRVPLVFTDADTGETWMLADDGRVAVDASAWADAPKQVPHAFVEALADSGRSFEGSFFARKQGADRILLVENGVRRQVAGERARARIALDRGLSTRTPVFPAATLESLPLGPAAQAPGAAVSAKGHGRLVVLSGDAAVAVSKSVQREVLGTTAVTDLSGADASVLSVENGRLGLGVTCAGTRYATLGGERSAISTSDARQWSPVFSFDAQTDAFCARIPDSGATVGQAVKLSNGDKFRIHGGERHRMSNAVYRELKPQIGTARTVSKPLLERFPSGGRELG